MTRRLNLTYATGIVLLAVERGYCFGFDIMDATGLPDGTVYPALRRLEAAGMMTSDWESFEAARAEKRPPRRNYRLTREGAEMLAAAKARFRGLELVLGTLEPEGA